MGPTFSLLRKENYYQPNNNHFESPQKNNHFESPLEIFVKQEKENTVGTLQLFPILDFKNMYVFKNLYFFLNKYFLIIFKHNLLYICQFYPLLCPY